MNGKAVQKLVDKTLEGVAKKFAADLRAHLSRTHRVTGRLASSIATARDGDGYAVGSDLPYAGPFEARTGAVEAFAAEWAKTAAGAAAQAGEQVAGAVL